MLSNEVAARGGAERRPGLASAPGTPKRRRVLTSLSLLRAGPRLCRSVCRTSPSSGPRQAAARPPAHLAPTRSARRPREDPRDAICCASLLDRAPKVGLRGAGTQSGLESPSDQGKPSCVGEQPRLANPRPATTSYTPRRSEARACPLARKAVVLLFGPRGAAPDPGERPTGRQRWRWRCSAQRMHQPRLALGPGAAAQGSGPVSTSKAASGARLPSCPLGASGDGGAGAGPRAAPRATRRPRRVLLPREGHARLLLQGGQVRQLPPFAEPPPEATHVRLPRRYT
jgi:hypothetical protein